MLDIKLKNNPKLRRRLSVLGILLVTIITMCFFPVIHREAQAKLEKQKAEKTQEKAEIEDVNRDLLQELYRGCYVLYKEAAAYEGTQSAAELYAEISAGDSMTEEMFTQALDNEYAALSSQFENYQQ